MMAWLRRHFLTGFVVTVPLAVSVAALVWVFRLVDRMTSGVYEWAFAQRAPVYFPGVGILLTAVVVLVIGTVATNVIGRRLLARGEALLLHVPVFRTVYGPVKQLIAAFSPDNEMGFKRVVLVDGGTRDRLGFLTKEFTVDRGRGPESMVAVYVPTNHLYLGDIVVCPRDRVSFPDLTVEQGVRVFLTGGMALPGRVAAASEARIDGSND